MLGPFGLKPAVAIGGMLCETVVEAATDAALEVLMVCCALAPATKATVTIAEKRMLIDGETFGDSSCTARHVSKCSG